jgi:hypothetical protein
VLLKSDLRLDRWIFVYLNISIKIQKKKTEEELSVVLKKLYEEALPLLLKRPLGHLMENGHLAV